LNLYNCPTVAYSGEIDRQKQAADMMAAAMKKEGLTLVHVIGPKTPHRYHPEAKAEINRRIDAIVRRGRTDVPDAVRFRTWTLRYNRCRWVIVDGLEEHWKEATVEAEQGLDSIEVKTKHVTALTLSMPPGGYPLEYTDKPKVVLDGEELVAAPVLSD